MKIPSIKNHLLTAFLAGALLYGCSDLVNNDDPSTEARYVIITMSENTLTKPGYATVFSEMPSGDVSNVTSNSLQGLGMGGWRPYENKILKMFNTQGNEKGIEELVIGSGNQISPGKFIKTNNTVNGSGNFAIVSDTKGYYWDADEPLKLQTFNPQIMERTGSIDLAAHVTKTDEGVNFQAVGQHFLAYKNGKLFADITYGRNAGAQSGMFDDYFPDVYVAVIDEATGTYEKTITMQDTGGITYINDNQMYAFDTNGDLYVVFQGRSALGGKSKIGRIRAGATEFDSWSLDMDEIFPAGGKFVTVFAKAGKIYTTIPTVALTGGPSGNINFSEIWEFYVIDAQTKTRTQISGIPKVTNPGAAYGIFELDGKILFRVNAPSQNINGYYELNADGVSASQIVNVTEGGSVSGLYKIEVEVE